MTSYCYFPVVLQGAKASKSIVFYYFPCNIIVSSSAFKNQNYTCCLFPLRSSFKVWHKEQPIRCGRSNTWLILTSIRGLHHRQGNAWRRRRTPWWSQHIILHMKPSVLHPKISCKPKFALVLDFPAALDITNHDIFWTSYRDWEM